MDAEELLRAMDSDQRAAVTCPETATVIHAGAGSGKTRVLTHRIAYRIATGTANADRVLAITFTREAAAEMRRRLSHLGVARELQSVTVGTFHAIALALLRQRLSDLHKPMPAIINNRQQLLANAIGDHPLASRSREILIEIDSILLSFCLLIPLLVIHFSSLLTFFSWVLLAVFCESFFPRVLRTRQSERLF